MAIALRRKATRKHYICSLYKLYCTIYSKFLTCWQLAEEPQIIKNYFQAVVREWLHSVYADKMYIGNSCVFPAGWTVETLMQKHNSRPHNPDIANGFFRAELVEIWGRGIEKICSSCKENGIALPEYSIHTEDILVKFTALKPAECPKVRPLMTEDMVEVMAKGMTELEHSRFTEIWVKLDEQGEINSATAAKLLNSEQRTARRLLNKAEKLGLIASEGKTSDKVYKKK